MICPCGGQTAAFVDWPNVPLVNALPKPGDVAPRYPLTIRRCQACGTLQVVDPPPPEVLFPPDYPYISGAAFQPHAAHLAQQMRGRGTTWLDLASNDGTVVRAATQEGFEARGIDPARPEADIQGFFPTITQDWQAESWDVITALNVMAHIPDPLAFATEAARLLRPKGTFVVEVSELARMLAGARLDLLYHEHIWTWGRHGLATVLEQAGFGVQSIESYSAQGGAMRLWCQKGTNSRVLREVPTYKASWFDAARAKWTVRVDAIRHVISDGGRWVGYGAAAKGAMFAYHAQLGPHNLAYVVDETPGKQGRLTAYGVPIVPPEHLGVDPPDGVLILAWNYAPLIREKLKTFAGKVMVV